MSGRAQNFGQSCFVASAALRTSLLLQAPAGSEQKWTAGTAPVATWLRARDFGSFADWLTPVLPVGISACFGMLARRPAFMLARRHECVSVRTVPPDGASRVSLA